MDEADELTFSQQLEDWLRTEHPKTIGGLCDAFEEKSFAVLILVLMFVPALPAPTGGVTHVFELMTMTLAIQMVVGRRTPWLPDRWLRRELGSVMTGKAIPFIVRRLRTFERISRPRRAELFDRGWMLRLLGVLFFFMALGAAFAPPFSGLDTIPSLGAVIAALAVIQKDVVVLAIGIAIGLGGIALVVTVGFALFKAAQGVL
jgi:hypothetical protein